nr:MAG TPA: hypothetical protein [Caudoviricetes sp.]
MTSKSIFFQIFIQVKIQLPILSHTLRPPSNFNFCQILNQLQKATSAGFVKF